MFQKLCKTIRTLTSVASTSNLNVLNVPALSKTMSEEIIRKPRYDGRSKKRQWEDRRSDKGEAFDKLPTKHPKVADSDVIFNEKGEKIKRRKFVLLMGYCGVDYYGMQRNPHTKTIEEELFLALKKCNFINDECYNQVQNMQFQRAARTDKGVSAARQIVSLKLGENLDLQQLNAQLPDVIRVFAYKRVTKGFNSKSQCDSRTYFYMLPTVAFAPQEASVDQETFRVDPATIERVNNLLKNYVGTKNYHNFTAKKKPNDPSANRYMKSLICEEPFVRKGVEFAVLKIHGQSFMMHQIRKMVGLLLAIVRGLAKEDIFPTAFSMERVNIPRAPGLGLVLDYVHYERYNYRYGSDGCHEKLVWDEVEEEINAFKEAFIYPTIIDTEIKDKLMQHWLNSKLVKHSYADVDEEDDDEKNSDDECDENDSADVTNDAQVPENNEEPAKISN